MATVGGCAGGGGDTGAAGVAGALSGGASRWGASDDVMPAADADGARGMSWAGGGGGMFMARAGVAVWVAGWMAGAMGRDGRGTGAGGGERGGATGGGRARWGAGACGAAAAGAMMGPAGWAGSGMLLTNGGTGACTGATARGAGADGMGAGATGCGAAGLTGVCGRVAVRAAGGGAVAGAGPATPVGSVPVRAAGGGATAGRETAPMEPNTFPGVPLVCAAGPAGAAGLGPGAAVAETPAVDAPRSGAPQALQRVAPSGLAVRHNAQNMSGASLEQAAAGVICAVRSHLGLPPKGGLRSARVLRPSPGGRHNRGPGQTRESAVSMLVRLGRFSELHERARGGNLSGPDHTAYLQLRDQVARMLLGAQRLLDQPGQLPRHALRVAQPIPVELAWANAGKHARLETLDVSASGFAVVCEGQHEAGSMAKFKLKITDEVVLEGQARLMGIKPHSQGERLGFAITEISDDARERLEMAVFDTVLHVLQS